MFSIFKLVNVHNKAHYTCSYYQLDISVKMLLHLPTVPNALAGGLPPPSFPPTLHAQLLPNS